MDPLIPVAAAQFPDIVRVIAKHRDVEALVVSAVSGASGETALPSVRTALAGDPAKVVDLYSRLVEIALNADRQDADDELQQDDIQANDDTTGARAMMIQIMNTSASLTSPPALLSFIVVLGFFTLVGLLLSGYMPAIRAAAGSVGVATIQLVNICFGAMTAGFATVLNFWLGSSLGSRHKDAVLAATQVQKKPAP